MMRSDHCTITMLMKKAVWHVYSTTFRCSYLASSPSSTPVTMEAKLSSRRIMSAACLETSEPVMPMAMPISAFFSAGESFTPSPVTATMAPCL
ncbi:hypothetical protein U0070_004746 [Myodes glareolus]|uniref:Uncharacterized protein n=1 Tax=Myodes glareolus TaxID=447135 RepID=A0AAW0HVP8_MYOGA